MTDNDSAGYYLDRAEQEEEAARVTTNELAATIHLSLAIRYRAKASERDASEPEESQKIRLIRG